MSAFPLPSMLTLPSILSANQSISYHVTKIVLSLLDHIPYLSIKEITSYTLDKYITRHFETYNFIHIITCIHEINFNQLTILWTVHLFHGSLIKEKKGWFLANRLAGNQGCVDGLSGGVRGVGDVKPGREHAPEILCVRRALGISAFRRAGSGSGALAVGTRAARRRRRQTLPGRTQIRLLHVARLPVVLLHLHTLRHR